jgi:aspartyl/asparaginyl-tRNA synthetase
MKEKGRSSPTNYERYRSYIELRDAGLPPHGGVGIGVDRLVRYFLKLPHVKDVLPYPRLYGRRWNP